MEGSSSSFNRLKSYLSTLFAITSRSTSGSLDLRSVGVRPATGILPAASPPRGGRPRTNGAGLLATCPHRPAPLPHAATPPCTATGETQGSPDAPLPSSPSRCHLRPGVSPASVALCWEVTRHECAQKHGAHLPSPTYMHPRHNPTLLLRGCGFLAVQ